MAPFPYPKIVELREKYMYNIRPLANQSLDIKSKIKTKDGYASSDDEDDEVNQMNVGSLGLLSPHSSQEGWQTRSIKLGDILLERTLAAQ